MIAVLGPGGVGGFVAAALARAGSEVLVVAREPTAVVVARSGISVQSLRLGEFTARPRATFSLREPTQALIVACKATSLEPALRRVHVVPGLVVPLLNGLDHMEVLRERFPGRVAAGTIRVEADRPAPGRVVQTSPFLRVDLAAEEPELAAPLARLGEALAAAGIPVQIVASEKQILWSKLVRLNALACTTSAADRPIGFIRSDPRWRVMLERCIAEAAAVARADGADVDPGERFDELAAAHPELGSSMQRDIAAGRVPELDAIPGSILRAAARHGLRCPTIAALTVQVAQRAGIPPPAV